MNADVKRQAFDNSGRLFDKNGPTSLGSLPRGEIVPRLDSLMITATQQASSFSIGANTRTNPIPDAILIRGAEEIRKRNNAGIKEAIRDNRDGVSFMEKVKVSSLQGEANQGAGANSAMSNSAPMFNGFLNQGLDNPTKRVI